MVRFIHKIGCAGTVIAAVAATSAASEDDWQANYTLFGTPGIIDMPSAVAPGDGQFASTVAVFGDTQRASFSFQVLPRLSGSFRYSLIDTYDRSFDFQYQIAEEGQYIPGVAVGLRDFLGTGRYSSEYVVATKTLGSNVRVTGGLGWGRLGSVNGFANPLGAIDERFDTRPDDSIDTGGTVLTGQFFRGDAALFGGVEWRLNDDWAVLAEYSSDAYQRESDLVGFDRQSPLNFGVTYSPKDSYQIGAYYMYGTDVGVSATFIFDPKTNGFPSGFDKGPLPVALRGANPAAAASWPTPAVQQVAVDALGSVLDTFGFRLIAAEVSGTTMRVRYENTIYRAEAQGVGRLARILTQVAPTSVDTFVLEPTRRGIALSAVTLGRGDIEALENEPNAAALSYDRAAFSDAARQAPAYAFRDPAPAFKWGIAPYLEVSLFDGQNPVAADLGVEAAFTYDLQPNLVLSGSYRQRIVGDRSTAPSISDSDLFPVRRETQLYGADGNGIEDLSLTWYGRPGPDLYSRVSVGYLERLYGGISSEILWKPVNSPLALGAEVSYVVLRDFDLGFGFQDFDTVTGHVSAYYDLNNGFQAQVNVGRYLAGDIGATFRLDREFENGWKVGGYFTLTDVSFEDFGEGSFDKGIIVEIPNDWLFGTPTRNTTGTRLSSLVRDGGARVKIQGRLYHLIEDGHQGMMQENWGRFWR